VGMTCKRMGMTENISPSPYPLPSREMKILGKL